MSYMFADSLLASRIRTFRPDPARKLPPSNVANLATLEGGSCIVPEAVVSVFCTPDDGCG